MKKSYIYCGLVSLSVSLAGCTLTRQNVSLPPVGPAPAFVQGARAPEGWLVVYSALDDDMSLSDDPIYPHSGYKIYSLDGTRLEYVNNNLAEPDTVSLPPGEYIVIASATSFNVVTLPVVIEDGKTTDVHLDGSAPAIEIGAPTSDVVRLPDGMIVGWRAG